MGSFPCFLFRVIGSLCSSVTDVVAEQSFCKISSFYYFLPSFICCFFCGLTVSAFLFFLYYLAPRWRVYKVHGVYAWHLTIRLQCWVPKLKLVRFLRFTLCFCSPSWTADISTFIGVVRISLLFYTNGYSSSLGDQSVLKCNDVKVFSNGSLG